jgi:hypothetical protein
VANDASIHLGHRGVMNLVPYQLDPALQALRQPRSRILIADAVGLGKTLEAGILATELIQRGKGKRILVVTQKACSPSSRRSGGAAFPSRWCGWTRSAWQRVRNRIPANHNPFNYFDRSIISIDTLKSNLEYRNYLENAWWDIIVIDECHNVAARAGESGLSRRAGWPLLATRSDTLILLSATPHDGSARSFASLMSLLDPTAISDPDDYTPDDFRKQGPGHPALQEGHPRPGQRRLPGAQSPLACARRPARRKKRPTAHCSPVAFTQGGQHKAGKQQELQRVGMQKALFSSPAAALESTKKRIQLLHRQAHPTATSSRGQGLQELADALQALVTTRRPKLLQQVPAPADAAALADFGWQGRRRPTAWSSSPSASKPCAGCSASSRPTSSSNPSQLEVLHGGR